jgi:hypothetical protein
MQVRRSALRVQEERAGAKLLLWLNLGQVVFSRGVVVEYTPRIHTLDVLLNRTNVRYCALSGKSISPTRTTRLRGWWRHVQVADGPQKLRGLVTAWITRKVSTSCFVCITFT